MLVAIDSSSNPGEKLDEAMQIPIFTEFMDVCMKVIEGKEEMSWGKEHLRRVCARFEEDEVVIIWLDWEVGRLDTYFVSAESEYVIFLGDVS